MRTRSIVALKIEVVLVVVVGIFVYGRRLGPLLTGVRGRVTHEHISRRNTYFRKTPGEKRPFPFTPGHVFEALGTII
jgi:hypothetical protein